MPHHAVEDWDDAYATGPNIARSDRWPDAWAEPAAAFRERMQADGQADFAIRYGARDRNCLDLFRPRADPRGLVVFVHGGFWMRTDRSFWSHLAAGPLAHGYAVAIPSYTLCPAVRIREIVAEIGLAIATAAGRVQGPLILAGHSAGGQLVTRMASRDAPIEASVAQRVAHVMSLSGLHDLRPLMRTRMNEKLHLDMPEALAESPALLEPMAGLKLTCWVGAAERAEFIRQNALLANIWKGLGAATMVVEEPDRHHFNVVEGLCDPDHAMTRTLLSL